MRITINTLFFLLLSVSATAQADNFKAFEWDILRFGYASPGLEAYSGGIALSTEPRFNLKDQISVGLRVELALFGAGDGAGDNVSIGASGSYTLMGDYYFSDTKTTRAFAGLGLGYFGGASVEVEDGNGDTVGEADGGGTIGLAPRVGYELGHLRLSAEYNLAFKESVPNYFGLHLGITIGGGAK